mgnify:CR=1 FL=1
MNGLSTALTVIGLVTGHQFVLVFSVKLVVIHLDHALVLRRSPARIQTELLTPRLIMSHA